MTSFAQPDIKKQKACDILVIKVHFIGVCDPDIILLSHRKLPLTKVMESN